MKDVFGGGWNRVIDHAMRAIEYDPKFAPGYVLLADAYNFLGLLSLMKPRLAFTKARQAAERALKLDDELASAHAALALVQFAGDWDWESAETSFRRALDIDEDLAVARIHYSWLLGLLERSAAAFEEADAALVTSKSRIVMAGAALTYFMAERYDEAIELCDRCLRIDGSVIFATYLRGQCYHMQQRYDLAQVDLERAALLGNRAPFYLGLLGKSYGEAGQRQAALRVVEELDCIAATHYVAPHCYVYILHGLGERERALEHQEQAYEDGAPPLNYLTPYIRHLFSLDPKHRDRLRQMRLDV